MTRPALPENQLERIGVLLLRHQAAAGRGAVGELEEPEFLGREEDEILGDPAQVHHRQSAGVKARRDEITIAGRIHAVGDDAGEAKRRGERLDVHRIAGTGNGAGAERQLVGLVEHHAESAVVAPERGGVRQEEVRSEDRLGASQMRVGRHQRVAGPGGAVGQHPNELHEGGLERGNPALQVQAEVERDLLVARPARVQPSARRADARDQLALDERVDVLVVPRRLGIEELRIGPAARQNLPEASPYQRGVGRRQDAGPFEPLRPREAARHVVVEQPAVEAERHAEIEERRVRFAGKSSGP